MYLGNGFENIKLFYKNTVSLLRTTITRSDVVLKASSEYSVLFMIESVWLEMFAYICSALLDCMFVLVFKLSVYLLIFVNQIEEIDYFIIPEEHKK